MLRQEREWSEEQDYSIVIAQANIFGLIDRLCDFVGIPSAGN